MDFLRVKEVGYSYNQVDNVFDRLKILTKCIKDDYEQISFIENEKLIYETLESIINRDNQHLLTAIFLTYVLCYSMAYKNNDVRVWNNYLNIIKNVCSENVNEAIYYFTGFVRYYYKENNEYTYVSNRMFYNEGHSFFETFKELLKLDDELRDILNKYKVTMSILNREFLGSTSNIRMSLNGVLAVIVSYCVVTKSYDKYEEMVKNMFSDVENISDKMEMNGIKMEFFEDDKLVKGNPKASECVEFVLDILSNQNKRTIN